jgi:FMN-dependent NADH-azoreductase
MSLFRLDASVRVDGSHSREIADIVEREWRALNPDDEVVRRDVGREPVPATAWSAAVSGGWTPEEQRTPEQREAIEIARREVDKLVAADALLFAAPLYNYGVSQHFKTWVDLAITDPRLASGAESAIAGKPAVLVTVRGGGYGPGTPREGWDHGIGWMRRILADVWHLDLKVIESELTLVGVNPALDQFKELAREIRASAERAAVEHGRVIARPIAA